MNILFLLNNIDIFDIIVNILSKKIIYIIYNNISHIVNNVI